jgi:hypothetical protein
MQPTLGCVPSTACQRGRNSWSKRDQLWDCLNFYSSGGAMADLIETLRNWVRDLLPHPPAALPGMCVRPDGSKDNGLMVWTNFAHANDDWHHAMYQMQFFTWESKHPDMSWWEHFEKEVPYLAELGVTQIWLPPPNKAMVPVSQSVYWCRIDCWTSFE